MKAHDWFKQYNHKLTDIDEIASSILLNQVDDDLLLGAADYYVTAKYGLQCYLEYIKFDFEQKK